MKPSISGVQPLGSMGKAPLLPMNGHLGWMELTEQEQFCLCDRKSYDVTLVETASYSRRVTYKLSVIMHRCRHGKAPQYLVDCCTPVTDVVGRQRLRSATQQLMVVPQHRLTTVGRRAFAVHGPMVWNSLPDDLRAQQDYESFRQSLKTWLFSRY